MSWFIRDVLIDEGDATKGYKKEIVMTKGDTAIFKIGMKVKNAITGELEDYIPQDEDVIIFAVKKRKNDAEPLFSFQVPKDTMIVKFEEAHTKNLARGTYIWEISCNRYFGTYDDEGIYVSSSQDYHDTFLPEQSLVLTTEVY